MLPGTQENLLEMFVTSIEEGKQESQTGNSHASYFWAGYTRVKGEHGWTSNMLSLKKRSSSFLPSLGQVRGQ